MFRECGDDGRTPEIITDMSIRFLAPFTNDVTAEARVIKTGRSLVTVSIDPCDANRTRIAAAQVTDILLGAVKPTAK